MWSFGKYADKIALQNDLGDTLSYNALQREDQDFFRAIGRRCLVFILCRNSIGAVIGYTSCLNNRVVPVLLNADLEQDLLDNLLVLYKPAYIWTPNDRSPSFPGMECVLSKWEYDLLRTDYPEEYALNDDLCLLLTTSGSTGSPKLVRQSYRNVESNARAIVEYLHLDDGERPITTLPMNYTYGLSIINSHLMVGATILLTDKSLMQKGFWGLFKDAGATSFGGVPYTYEILDKLRFARMSLPSLRYMTQAGGKLSKELHRKFAEYAEQSGVRFVVMYGQCEATARMGYLPPEKALEKCGAMGIAIPGGEFRLVDDNGNTIDTPYTPGELVYSGENVTLGYAQSGEDLILGDERNGVLFTGDVAQRDEDGYYYIVGRKKRFLKIYGNRVNLDEVERMIKEQFPQIDMVCSGVDDHMFLFLTDETKQDEVKSFISMKTGLNPAAFRTVVIDGIPRNDSGKILYKELEKYYDV